MAKERSGVTRRLRKGWFMSDVERRAREFQYAAERGYSGSETEPAKSPEQLLDEIEGEDERR
ncbi:MAG: hypothetical protein ACOX4G_11795 [Limnochordia bacterium]